MKTSTLLVVLIPALGGCAELRTEFTPATGEAMRVHDRTVTRTGVEQVATGEDEIRSSSGEVVATNTHYQNQQVSWQEREWYPRQGFVRIDDESFYRITKDDDAVARYDGYHHGGVTKNTIGWIMLGLGLGIAGGGAGTWFAGSSMKDASGAVTSTGQTLDTIGYTGLSIGAAVAVLGGTLLMLGKREAAARDVRIIDDPERMKADAARYNRFLMPMTTGGLAQPAWRRLYQR